MVAENMFAHAEDFETPTDYLKAVIEKQLFKNDKYSFEAEIMRHVKKEYRGVLTKTTKTGIL